jgi:putative transposase
MPRIARITIPGVAHHVTQRGNNRQRVFRDDTDRRWYLQLLAEETQDHGLTVLAYCLMDNHVHLVAVPEREDSLALGLGRTHFRFTQIANRRRRGSGHLWQNRFFSCPVEGDHFWRALRYVERNPVRAGLVRRAWDYPWSSAAAHCGRGEDKSGLLDLAAWAQRTRRRDWRAELTWREVREEMETLRRHTQTGRPLAGAALLERWEADLGRPLQARPVGRPYKHESEVEINR